MCVCVCMCLCVCVLDVEASVSFAFCCYLALFNVISGTRNSIDLEQFTNFLEQITQVLTFMKARVCVCMWGCVYCYCGLMHTYMHL